MVIRETAALQRSSRWNRRSWQLPLNPHQQADGGSLDVDRGRPFAPAHAGHWAQSSAREIGYPALNGHAKLKALIEQWMSIERGVLIVVQSVAKPNGDGIVIAKIKVGGHFLSSFSNQTHSAC
jgi:hypothetical protein